MICFSQPFATNIGDSSLLINPKVYDKITFLEANSLVFIKNPYEELKGKSNKPLPSIEKLLVL